MHQWKTARQTSQALQRLRKGSEDCRANLNTAAVVSRVLKSLDLRQLRQLWPA